MEANQPQSWISGPNQIQMATLILLQRIGLKVARVSAASYLIVQTELCIESSSSVFNATGHRV